MPSLGVVPIICLLWKVLWLDQRQYLADRCKASTPLRGTKRLATSGSLFSSSTPEHAAMALTSSPSVGVSALSVRCASLPEPNTIMAMAATLSVRTEGTVPGSIPN